LEHFCSKRRTHIASLFRMLNARVCPSHSNSAIFAAC
jgi:hypothetical protein